MNPVCVAEVDRLSSFIKVWPWHFAWQLSRKQLALLLQALSNRTTLTTRRWFRGKDSSKRNIQTMQFITNVVAIFNELRKSKGACYTPVCYIPIIYSTLYCSAWPFPLNYYCGLESAKQKVVFKPKYIAGLLNKACIKSFRIMAKGVRARQESYRQKLPPLTSMLKYPRST